MEIFPLKAALIHADRRTKIKQMGVSVTVPEHIKVTCDSWEGRIRRQHFDCVYQWCQ